MEVFPAIISCFLQFCVRIDFQLLQHLYLLVNLLLFSRQFLQCLVLVYVNPTKRAVQLVQLLTIRLDLFLFFKRCFDVYDE